MATPTGVGSTDGTGSTASGGTGDVMSKVAAMFQQSMDTALTQNAQATAWQSELNGARIKPQ